MPIPFSDYFTFPFNGGKGIRKNQVEGLDGLENEIDELQARTSDLHAGVVHSGWASASAAEGGLAVVPGVDNGDVSLTAIRNVSAWVAVLESGLSSSNVLIVRIPHGDDLAHYRAVFAAIGGGTYLDDLSRYTLRGSDADSNPAWDYYRWDVPLSNSAGSVTLQITGSTDAEGTSTFRGNLVLAKVLAALGVDSVGDLGGGAGPLIENAFDGTTGDTVGEQEVDGVTIENLANVAYSIRVGAETEFTLGNALRGVRSGSPLQIGAANFYTKANDDKLYRTLDSASDGTLEIWQVNDLAALRAALAAAGDDDGSGSTTPAIAERFRGTLGASSGEVELSGVTLINDANVIYVVRVGDDVLHIPGDDLYGTVAGQPWVLGPVNFYSKGDGKLYQDIFTSWTSSTVLTVWQLVDTEALKEILDEIEPNHVDELRADLAKLHTYIAEHVTDISDEVLDPTQADSPAHYYLTGKAFHSTGGHDIPFESGLYELTTGAANKTKIKLERVGSNFWGYVNLGFGGHEDAGEMLHNPLSAVSAFYVELTSGGDYFAHAYMKKNVYDYLDGQVNLANTAVFFKMTDGTTERQFEMGILADTVVGGINYRHLRQHLLTTATTTATPAQFLAYFTAGNGNAPTLDIGYNPSFATAGRSDYHLRYGNANTTKAYTLRRSGFARLTGANDRFITSDQVDSKIVLTQAQYDALAAKNARTEYCIVG